MVASRSGQAMNMPDSFSSLGRRTTASTVTRDGLTDSTSGRTRVSLNEPMRGNSKSRGMFTSLKSGWPGNSIESGM